MAASRKKVRTEIPSVVAARVLFLADRTCCVCREQGKPVQIHHINDQPSDHAITNLAVLCFDCHRETQIRGGFDRKLDPDQVVLYRDDWNAIVDQSRARAGVAREAARVRDENDIALSLTIAEIYREAEAYDDLAIHYHVLGNYELRDKYIDRALEKDASDATVVYLRSLQRKPELIPVDVVRRVAARYTKRRDYAQRARFHFGLNKPVDAAKDYIASVHDDLKEGNFFSAAFYAREFVARGLIEELFVAALEQARLANELWWEVRALQELGWHDELRRVVLDNADAIDRTTVEDDGTVAIELKELLAAARGETAQATERRKELAREIAKGAGYVWKPRNTSRE